MSLQTFVKISNVSSLSDARYCAGMMVDVLGFNIDPSSDDQVKSEDFKEITEWVAGVQFAGEFHDATIDQIKEVIKAYPVDYIEIEKVDLVEKVQLLGKPIILRLNISASNVGKLKSTLSYADELVAMVILKCDDASLFDDLDAQVGFYNGNLKLLKGYGIEMNDHLHKYPGLELEATKEERPGFKDYGQIMDVLEAIEEE